MELIIFLVKISTIADFKSSSKPNEIVITKKSKTLPNEQVYRDIKVKLYSLSF